MWKKAQRIVVWAVFLSVPEIGLGQGNAEPQLKISPGQVEVEFPDSQKAETAWKVLWEVDGRHGLIIREAWFHCENKWLKVLGDCRVAEIFVPYYPSKTVYFDIKENYTRSMPVSEEMARPGKVVDGKVALEIRDRGILWIDQAEGKEQPVRTHRGRELVLWSPVRAGWYIYLFQFSFRDDGSIAFRSGSTGHNSPKEPHVAHMHNTCWRLDIDLGIPEKNGMVKNAVRLGEHKEPGQGRRHADQAQFETVFNGGIEGGLPWNAEKFTKVRVLNNAIKNDNGNPISYDLVPLRSGSARHADSSREEFTKNDFWVTPFAGVDATTKKPNQMDFQQLPEYVKEKRSIEDADVVLWYVSSALHVPRDEDMLHRKRPAVTMMVWSGFDLQPRDLFSAAPFFAPPRPLAKQGPAPTKLLKEFSTADLEKIMQVDLKKRFDKRQSSDNNLVVYQFRDTDYQAVFNAAGKFVLFQVVVPAGKVTLDKINRWNRDAIFSRAYVTGDKLYFEVLMSFATGVTRDSVIEYHDITEREWSVFRKHLESIR